MGELLYAILMLLLGQFPAVVMPILMVPYYQYWVHAPADALLDTLGVSVSLMTARQLIERW